MRNSRFVTLLAAASLSLAMLKAGAQTRILPLGDSITSSFAPYSSYRYWLWHDLVDKGFDVDFVGTQSGVADGTPTLTDYDQDHEGHPGWTTQDAVENIDSIAAATQPDIVLLDLGANDIEEGLPLQTTVSNLEAIIESIRAVNPSVVILLAQPTPYRGQNNARMFQLEVAIGKVARIENEPGSRVIPIHLFMFFNIRKFTYDGVHTNVAGEKLIANRFFAVLKRVL